MTKCIICKKRALYNYKEEKTPTHCNGCKDDRMIDIHNKKCIVCNLKSPNFNYENEIKPTLFNNLIAVKNSLIIRLTNNHMEGRDFWKVPSITNFNLFKHNFFIFPKLLLTYSAFAFFIGLFAQVAFQGSNYKENL